MNFKKTKIAIALGFLPLYSSSSFSEAITIDVLISSKAADTPINIVRNASQTIYNELNALTNRTEQQDALLATLDYINTSTDEEGVVKALLEISPKRNGGTAIVSRKSPSAIPIKGIGKRLSALRKSAKRSNFLGKSKPASARNDRLSSDLIKYNTDPALESGGLLDQRLSAFVTANGIIAEQSDTLYEAGFDGSTKQLTAGADYRVNNKTFAGAAMSFAVGNMDMTQGGKLDNTSSTLLLYATRSINDNWFADVTFNAGTRSFEMERSINFTQNTTTVVSEASSTPDGSVLGMSFGTGYDFVTNSGHSLSLLASFNYSKSSIDAFEETGSSAYKLAIGEQTIESKMIEAGVEWRQAISTSFGVVLPQLSAKWVTEFEDKADAINARFVADPSNTNLHFETGNKDQSYMNLRLGATLVLPKGLAGFAQYETQQFIADYQQSMFSLGARKEF